MIWMRLCEALNLIGYSDMIHCFFLVRAGVFISFFGELQRRYNKDNNIFGEGKGGFRKHLLSHSPPPPSGHYNKYFSLCA
jgi:hypothetical protein